MKDLACFGASIKDRSKDNTEILKSQQGDKSYKTVICQVVFANSLMKGQNDDVYLISRRTFLCE